MNNELLIPREKYLEAGIHIGTKLKNAEMNDFIYRSARQDRFYVLDLKKVDERIRLAAKFIARFPPASILVVASRIYAGNAATKFCEMIGARLLSGRFIPGVLTNPARETFLEPSLVLLSDPKGERQALKESSVTGVPVIALVDTDNSTRFVDLAVPCNNKGRKSLALVFWLLAREVLKARGTITSDDQFTTPLEDFETEAGAQVAPEMAEEAGAPGEETIAAADQSAAEKPAEKTKRKKKAEAPESAPA